MSHYIRIIDSNSNTIHGYTTYKNRLLSSKESHIFKAKQYSMDEVERDCHPKSFPVTVQVVRKKTYKNGTVTKKVIYENTIFPDGQTSEKQRIENYRKTICEYRNNTIEFAKDFLGIRLKIFQELVLKIILKN